MRFPLLLAVLLVPAWFAFSLVSGIDTGDIVAYHKLQKHVVAGPFRPGNVVAFASDSSEPMLICSLDVRDGVLKRADVNKTYVNEMSAKLPEFTGLVNWFAGLLGGDGGKATANAGHSGLPFVGFVSSFPRAGMTPDLSPDCACEIVRSLARSERVCTVERSLIETEWVQTGTTHELRETTVGITVREGNFFFSELPDCPRLPQSAVNSLPQEPGLCGERTDHSFDVALRNKLQLIVER